MQITINTDTLAATLSGTPVPKAGGFLPLELYFQDLNGNPVSLADGYLIEYGLRLAAAPSSGILAYTDEFSAASENSYAGLVNLNDTRMMGAIAGNPQLSIAGEIAWTVAGQRFVSSNFAFFVQPPIIAPGASSSGGPFYVTTQGAGLGAPPGAPGGDGYYYLTPYLRYSAAYPPQQQVLEDGEWVTVTTIS